MNDLFRIYKVEKADIIKDQTSSIDVSIDGREAA